MVDVRNFQAQKFTPAQPTAEQENKRQPGRFGAQWVPGRRRQVGGRCQYAGHLRFGYETRTAGRRGAREGSHVRDELNRVIAAVKQQEVAHDPEPVTTNGCAKPLAQP